eukprot:Seg7764.1 transcript_id=Seg7764.1/GoldUCD/mRNA.D3Y31 product="hypothetical protein" protein_id=Seg7764.1/GoldUCD/D3Y31
MLYLNIVFALQEKDKKDEMEKESSQSEMLQHMYEPANEEDNLDQALEEHMRDLCVLSKTIPSKCVALLNEEFELRTQSWETAVSSIAEPSNIDSEGFKLSFEEFDRCFRQYEECEEENSFPEEFDDLTQQCRNLIQLKKVQSGMGLNDTQELLYGGRRKREAENPLQPQETGKHITRPGFEDLPSLSSPISSKDSAMKKASSSKIPRRKKGHMTPVTPISRASSLRKKVLTKSAGKT